MEDFMESTEKRSTWKHALDSSLMKKTAAESKTKGKKLNPQATCAVKSCLGNITTVYSDKTCSSTCSGMGCDTSS